MPAIIAVLTVSFWIVSYLRRDRVSNWPRRHQLIETVCSWCHPGDNRPGISHGICEHHRAEMESQIQ